MIEELRPGADVTSPGTELLRALAGYPTRRVHLGRHTVESHVVEIHRDPAGRVIGSTERIERSTYTDTIGDFLD